MAESISSLAAMTASHDGGAQLDFEETSVLNGEFLVYVGASGDATDALAWPAARGRGRRILVSDGAFSIVLPELAPGGPYKLFMLRVKGTGDAPSLTSNAFLTIVPAQLRSRVFSYRSGMHPKMEVGPRESSKVEYPQD